MPVVPVVEATVVQGAPVYPQAVQPSMQSRPFLNSPAGAYAANNGQPRGAWRVDLCSCFDDCCICLSAACCHCVVLGQVWQRVTGEPGSCKKYFFISFAFTFMMYVFWMIPSIAFLGSLLSAAYTVLRVALGMQARARVRMVDNIPESSCNGCEDCCCAFWCSCCTDIQILRHTGVPHGRYSLQSETGTDPGVAPDFPGGV